MNALRHGLYASTLILPGENPADFDRIRGYLQFLHQPEGPYEQDLVKELAILEWKRLRAELIEGSLLIEHGDDPASVYLPEYQSVSRIQGRLRRDKLKISKDLHILQAARRKEAARQAQAEPVAQAEPAVQAEPAAQAAPAEPAPTVPPPAPEDEEEWATDEEIINQTGREKNYKRSKYFELWWTPVKGEPPKLITRLYKGKQVDEWPADDPPGPRVIERCGRDVTIK